MTDEPLETILIVEDDRHIRQVAKLALTQSPDLAVECAASGRDALDRVGNLQPDPILLDVMMPGLDGLDVLDALQDDPQTAEIPVVFLTAKAQPTEIEEYRERGVVDVIVKPFDPMKLADQVEGAWAASFEP